MAIDVDLAKLRRAKALLAGDVIEQPEKAPFPDEHFRKCDVSPISKPVLSVPMWLWGSTAAFDRGGM